MIKKVFCIFLGMFLCGAIWAQKISKLEFYNQKITDILMILSEEVGITIIPDETVQGTTSFYFKESDFATAFTSFLYSNDLYAEKKDSVYYVSKIFIQQNENSLLTIYANNVDVSHLLSILSKKIKKTILFDALPKISVSVHGENLQLSSILEILLEKLQNYELVKNNDIYYFKKITTSTSKTKLADNAINRKEDFYSINIKKNSFIDVISKLFELGKKEYSLLTKTNQNLENLVFTDKTFEEILHLILEQVNADFTQKNSIYYIYEIQRNDVVRKLRDTEKITLKNILAHDVIPLFPANFNVNTLIKVDKISNSLYITGTEQERKTIVDFVNLVDIPQENKKYERFDLSFIEVEDAISLIPSSYFYSTAIVVPHSHSFVVLVTDDSEKKIKEFIKKIDIKRDGIPIRLKYISSDDLLRYLPPSISREEIVITTDASLVFYVGAVQKKDVFLKELALIDVPKPQIRYELLVVQYQKSNALNWSKSLTVNPLTNDTMSSVISGGMTNLLNVNFDIISQFGYQFALKLNYEIGESKARILADTTLHGLSGSEVTFQNTNTYRYKDSNIDQSTGEILYSTTTREIISGLQMSISGWVSGEEMITMKVNAQISKQGETPSGSNNPPPTSEKVVTSEIRTKSGEPIIIGGLLQTEKTSTMNKVPVLGSIPLIGVLFRDVIETEEITEMVLYVVPHIFKTDSVAVEVTKNIERYYNTYILEQ